MKGGFYDENAARTQGKGTGLGLTIVKRIVELHGGAITLSESPSFGTVEFHIRLPEIK